MQQATPTLGQRQNLMHLHLTRKGSCNSCNNGYATIAATKKLPLARNTLAKKGKTLAVETRSKGQRLRQPEDAHFFARSTPDTRGYVFVDKHGSLCARVLSIILPPNNLGVRN